MVGKPRPRSTTTPAGLWSVPRPDQCPSCQTTEGQRWAAAFFQRPRCFPALVVVFQQFVWSDWLCSASAADWLLFGRALCSRVCSQSRRGPFAALPPFRVLASELGPPSRTVEVEPFSSVAAALNSRSTVAASTTRLGVAVVHPQRRTCPCGSERRRATRKGQSARRRGRRSRRRRTRIQAEC